MNNKVNNKESQAHRRPNIIFIMTDDQGPWTLGVGNNPNVRTPNLDRLARSGAQLENYFGVAAVCSPCRASVITGRYSTEVGITDFIPGGSDKKEAALGLAGDIQTWPQVFQL